MADFLSTTFKVGYRYRCTMSMDLAAFAAGDALSLTCRCSPKPPKKLSQNEIEDYRRGRDALMTELARVADGRVLVAETGTGWTAVIEPG
jgi:hypothetical protein